MAEAHSIDEVRSIHDKAVAMQAYARQAKDTSLITQATEIRMRAERRAGELLAEMKERGERDQGKGGDRKSRSQAATVKLQDIGITKSQSSRWQALAKIDQDDFEAKVKADSERASNAITYRLVKAAQIKEAQERHAKVIEHGCTVEDLTALANSGKRFSVICADPPWPWKTWGGASGKIRSAPDNHYGTSAVEDVMKLPVSQLAAANCALFMWCTGPHITIGSHIKVIEAWGFKPCTFGFDWVKTNADGSLYTGMGYFTRSNSEVCLIATKGSPLRLATDVHQIVMAPVGEHSAKPEEARRRIERLFPGPYLELYGRKSAPGWTVWGNEIRRDQFVAEVAA